MAGINLFYRFTNPIEKQKEQQKAQKDALIMMRFMLMSLLINLQVEH